MQGSSKSGKINTSTEIQSSRFHHTSNQKSTQTQKQTKEEGVSVIENLLTQRQEATLTSAINPKSPSGITKSSIFVGLCVTASALSYFAILALCLQGKVKASAMYASLVLFLPAIACSLKVVIKKFYHKVYLFELLPKRQIFNNQDDSTTQVRMVKHVGQCPYFAGNASNNMPCQVVMKKFNALHVVPVTVMVIIPDQQAQVTDFENLEVIRDLWQRSRQREHPLEFTMPLVDVINDATLPLQGLEDQERHFLALNKEGQDADADSLPLNPQEVQDAYSSPLNRTEVQDADSSPKENIPIENEQTIKVTVDRPFRIVIVHGSSDPKIVWTQSICKLDEDGTALSL